MAKLCGNKNGGQYRKARRQRQEQPENYPAREKGAANSFQAAFGIGGCRRAATEFQADCTPRADAASAPKAQRGLQLNATHPVFAKLVAAKEAGDKDRLALLGSILYDQALLVEGLPVDDPVEFARNVAKLM